MSTAIKKADQYGVSSRYNYIPNIAKKRTRINNQNYMLSIVGSTGSGKSYSAMALAMMIDPNFSIERVCFRAESFLELVTEHELKRGSVIMFDEAGIDVSSRDWQSKSNKAINQTVETFRRDNLVCIWTTPNFSNLDKKARSYFHGLGVMLEPEKVGWGAMKYYNIYSMSVSGDVGKAYPTIRDDDNRVVQISGRSPSQPNVFIPDPRSIGTEHDHDKGIKLIEAYERKKKDFTEWVKKQGLEDIRSEDMVEEKKVKLKGSDLIGFLAHNYDEFPFGKGLSEQKLARRCYAKFETIAPENFEVSKSEMVNVVKFVEEQKQEAKMNKDPSKNFEKEEDENVARLGKDIKPDELLSTFKMMYLKQNLSITEIGKRLNISHNDLYLQARKWRAQGELPSDEKDEGAESKKKWQKGGDMTEEEMISAVEEMHNKENMHLTDIAKEISMNYNTLYGKIQKWRKKGIIDV